MHQAMGQAQVHEVCLTQAQAKSPKEDFFTGADQNCRYEHFKWGDGKIDLKLNCKHPNATQTMELTGSYPARQLLDGHDRDQCRRRADGADGDEDEGRCQRIGECDGTEVAGSAN